MTDTKALLAARGKTHGDYTEHAELTQRLKEEMRDSPNWNDLPKHHRETLDMIAHKIGRVLCGDPNFRDHWDDIAGYAVLSAERCSK
jgi:hypothetical protein